MGTLEHIDNQLEICLKSQNIIYFITNVILVSFSFFSSIPNWYEYATIVKTMQQSYIGSSTAILMF